MRKSRKKKGGRSKGSRNRGYFYRESRGCWVDSGSMKALLDSSGQKITDRKPDSNVLVAAYARFLEQSPKAEQEPAAPIGTVTVGTLATKYILAIKGTARPETVRIRQKYLLKFCDSGFQKQVAETITKADIERWLNSNKGWGPGSR